MFWAITRIQFSGKLSFTVLTYKSYLQTFFFHFFWFVHLFSFSLSLCMQYSSTAVYWCAVVCKWTTKCYPMDLLVGLLVLWYVYSPSLSVSFSFTTTYIHITHTLLSLLLSLLPFLSRALIFFLYLWVSHSLTRRFIHILSRLSVD